MSNPAVIKLNKKNIGKSHVWLDDNFGEAIHIHIDDIRVDLSTREFENISEKISNIINELIGVEGFDCSSIDPIYLDVMLRKNLLHLIKVRKDEVNLGDLLAPGIKGIVPLYKSRGVKALEGNTKENDKSKRVSQHIDQTNQERLDSMCGSIKKNGYPFNNQYIILYGDDNIIRDGQHRASCLYHLYGNIKIPVIRFYFDNYKKENILLSRVKIYTFFSVHINKIRSTKSILEIYLLFRKSLGKLYRKIKSINQKIYSKKNSREIQYLKNLLDNR